MTEAQLMADLIQLRRDTAANWTSANPTLSQGEQGYETDTGKMKIGDGSTAWSSLDYFVDSSAYATSSDITSAVATKANTADLATVATSGSYDDLSDQPTIPSITGLATETYVDTAVSNLVDAAPETLDTLNELAAALGDDADFATTTATSIGLKANTADLATVATSGAYSDLTGTPTVPTALTDLSITDGTAGQVLSADGDGTYTFIDAASGGGGGGGSFEAVASGSLSDGSTVILNADGTVSVVAEIGYPEGAGTASAFETVNTDYISATFDSNSNKVIIAYVDSNGGSNFKAIVGTVSGTSISFGTPVVFTTSYAPTYVNTVYDSNNDKVIIAYSDGGYGRAVVGTVSGTSISFGTATTIEILNAFVSATFDSNSNKVVIAYLKGSEGKAVVGTVSGTSISFGTPTVFAAGGSVYYISATFDSNSNKVIIAYSDSGNSSYGTTVIGTVSGTSISFGTPAVFESASSTYISATFDSNSNKVVIAYRDIANTNQGTTIVGTVSGTSISFDTPVVFESGSTDYISATFDSNSNKVVIAYRDIANTNQGTTIVGTVSGTSISFDTPVVFESGSTDYISATFDSNSNKVVIAYADTGNSSYGTAIVYNLVAETTTNLTAENYAGIADAAYADAATATIQTAGSVDDAQSGLTPGQAYYVQGDGTLGLTPATPSVFAGTAVSATSLLIGKEAPAATVAYADVTGTPDLSSYATETYVDTAVSNLVDTAPDALNTLNELAAALNDDADFAGTVTTSLAAKANSADLATVATSGSYNDLSDQPVIAAGGGSFEAVASGALANGDIVAVKADGTVGVVGLPGALAGFGTAADTIGEAQGHSASSSKAVVVSGGKIVVIYENGQTGYAIVGTISGSTITFGTPVSYESNAIANTAITYNSSLDKVAIFYCDRTTDADYTLWDAFAIVGTVSGDSISFETRNSVRSNSWQAVFPTYDSVADRIVLFYVLSTNSYGVAQVFSMNSTTVTSVSSVYYRSGVHSLFTAAYNPFTGNHILTYFYSDNGYKTQYRVASVSGNTISFGSEYDYTGYRTQSTYNWMIPGTDKLIHIWSNYTSTGGENGNVEIRVGTDSAGGSISWGTKYTIFTGPQGGVSYAAYDRTNNKGIIFYAGYNGSAWTYFYRLFTQSGNSISLESPITITSAEFRSAGNKYGYMFDSVSGKIILDKYNDFEPYQTVDTVGGVELTAENYIGISDGAYSDGATATIQIVGSVDDAQSGLTPGQAYYVQPNGTLATTAADPSVFAGTAVSTTKLIVKG